MITNEDIKIHIPPEVRRLKNKLDNEPTDKGKYEANEGMRVGEPIPNSFMTMEDIINVAVKWIPSSLNWENYRIVWVELNYLDALKDDVSLLNEKLLNFKSPFLVGCHSKTNKG